MDWLEPHWNLCTNIFTWLKQKQQKSYYFSIQNLSHILTKIMPLVDCFTNSATTAGSSFYNLVLFQLMCAHVCLYGHRHQKNRGHLFKAFDHVGTDVEGRVEGTHKEPSSLVGHIQNVVHYDIWKRDKVPFHWAKFCLGHFLTRQLDYKLYILSHSDDAMEQHILYSNAEKQMS